MKKTIKRCLLYVIFGPLIGSLAISLYLILMQLVSGNRNEHGYTFAYDYFILSIITGAAYIYGGVPSVITGAFSSVFDQKKISDVFILLVLSSVITCAWHYFLFDFKFFQMIQMSILPSMAATLILTIIIS